MVKLIKNWVKYWYYFIQIKRDVISLKRVPEELRDYNICITAVSLYGPDLNFVPGEHKDYNLYYTAVSNDGCSLYYVPSKYRDYKMCYTAVSSDDMRLFGRYIIECVPKEHLDYNLCYTAVLNTDVLSNRKVLKYILDKDIKVRIAKELNIEI